MEEEEEEEDDIPVKETYVHAPVQALQRKRGRSLSRRDEKRNNIKKKKDFPGPYPYGSCGKYGTMRCTDRSLPPKLQFKTMCQCLLGKTRTTARQAKMFRTPSTSMMTVTEQESQNNTKCVGEFKKPAETSSATLSSRSSSKVKVGRENGRKDRNKFRSPFKRDSSKGKRAHDVLDMERVDHVNPHRMSGRTSKSKLKSLDVPGQEWEDPADVRRMSRRETKDVPGQEWEDPDDVRGMSRREAKALRPSEVLTSSSEQSVDDILPSEPYCKKGTRSASSTDDSFEYLTFRMQPATNDDVCPCQHHRLARKPQCGTCPYDHQIQVPRQVQPDPQPACGEQHDVCPCPHHRLARKPQCGACPCDQQIQVPPDPQAEPCPYVVVQQPVPQPKPIPQSKPANAPCCCCPEDFPSFNVTTQTEKSFIPTTSSKQTQACCRYQKDESSVPKVKGKKRKNLCITVCCCGACKPNKATTQSIEAAQQWQQSSDKINDKKYDMIPEKDENNNIVHDNEFKQRNTADENQPKDTKKVTIDDTKKVTIDDNQSRPRDTIDSQPMDTIDSQPRGTIDSQPRGSIDSQPRDTIDSQSTGTIDSQSRPRDSMDENQLTPIYNNEFKRKGTKDESQYNLLKSRTSSTMQSLISEFTTLPLRMTHIKTKKLSKFGRPSTSYPWMQSSKSTASNASFTDARNNDAFDDWLDRGFGFKDEKQETFSNLTRLKRLKSSSSKSKAEERILLDGKYANTFCQVLEDDLVGFCSKNDRKELGILCDLNKDFNTKVYKEFIHTEDVGVQLCTPNNLDTILEQPYANRLDYLMTDIMNSVFCESDTDDIKNFQDSTSVDNKRLRTSVRRRTAKRGAAVVEKEETEYKKKLKQEEYSPDKISNIDDVIHKNNEKTAARQKQQEESDSEKILETHNRIESVDSYVNLNPSDTNIQVERHYPMSSDSICIVFKPLLDFKPKSISEEPQQCEAVENASLDSLMAVNNKLSKLFVQSFIGCNEKAILPSASSTEINKLGKRSIRLKHCSKASLIPIRK